jgi:HrpA-like RNA helicase
VDSLPASQPEVKTRLAKALDNSDFIIVKAETGAGKSVSIVPQILQHFNFKKKIICTQPRSINTEVANRVGEILDDTEKKYINFAYRFNVHTTKDTILSYETDGRVVNYFYGDPNFEKADILIIDEVHEKNPSIEFLLLFMKKLLAKPNNQKKLVIMSATIDIDYYKSYFSGIKTDVLEIAGRTFPVESIYLDKELNLGTDDYIKKTKEIIIDIINVQKKPGDILVFFPAISHIEKACQEINGSLAKELKETVVCLTLYRGLTEEQKEMITSEDKFRSMPGKPVRKIVYSTNIAESGVTIKGIKFVIESGLALNMSYDSATRMNVLEKQHISKFEIEQRKGRAGRTAPGICYHLYTEKQFKEFHQSKPSEILTMNLDYLVMDLLRTDLIKTVDAVKEYFSELIEPPNHMQIMSTIKYLTELQIIKDGKLTPLGKCLHHMNIGNVGVGIALLVSDYFDVTQSVVKVAAMLEIEPNIEKYFRRPNTPEGEKKLKNLKRSYQGTFSDIQMYLKLYNDYLGQKDRQKWCKDNSVNIHMLKKVQRIQSQIWEKYKTIPVDCKLKSNIEAAKDMNKNVVLAFLHGFFNNILLEIKPGNYQNLDNIQVQVQPGRFNSLSTLKSTIVYMSLNKIMGRVQAGGLINVTDAQTLMMIAPKDFDWEKKKLFQ